MNNTLTTQNKTDPTQTKREALAQKLFKTETLNMAQLLSAKVNSNKQGRPTDKQLLKSIQTSLKNFRISF